MWMVQLFSTLGEGSCCMVLRGEASQLLLPEKLAVKHHTACQGPPWFAVFCIPWHWPWCSKEQFLVIGSIQQLVRAFLLT